MNLTCRPGVCAGYSSTSYEVAGLILAAVLTPNEPWYVMDLGQAALPNRNRYASLVFPPVGNNRAVKSSKLSDVMTVPGTTVWSMPPDTIVFNQNPSILGWTCGNLIGSARDVATFFLRFVGP